MSDNLFAGLLDAEREQQKQLKNKDTQEVAQPRGNLRGSSRNNLRDNLREDLRGSSRNNLRDLSREEDSRHLPSRDEVQKFSFDLRDEVNVQVQALLPHHWQEELQQMAQEMKVGKLELYRYIYGVFLRKVKPKK